MTRGKCVLCFSAVTTADNAITVNDICQLAAESLFYICFELYRNNSQTFQNFDRYLQTKKNGGIYIKAVKAEIER